MTTTDAHIDAVARAIHDHDHKGYNCTCDAPGLGGPWAPDVAVILDSTDPAVHAAMLDALTRHGVLTEETRRANLWGNTYADQRRVVTAWEVTA